MSELEDNDVRLNPKLFKGFPSRFYSRKDTLPTKSVRYNAELTAIPTL